MGIMHSCPKCGFDIVSAKLTAKDAEIARLKGEVAVLERAHINALMGLVMYPRLMTGGSFKR